MEPIFIQLGGNNGEFFFSYDTLNIPDRIKVYHGTKLVAHSGGGSDDSDMCVGTLGGDWVTLNGTGPSQVKVVVEPNCDSSLQGLTAWAFKVSCPTDTTEPSPPDVVDEEQPN